LGLSLQSGDGGRRHHEDHSAGGISNAEAQKLIADFPENSISPASSFTTVSYANLLVYRGHEEFNITTKPPARDSG